MLYKHYHEMINEKGDTDEFWELIPSEAGRVSLPSVLPSKKMVLEWTSSGSQPGPADAWLPRGKQATLTAADRCPIRGKMAIKRLDHVSVVVDDLAAAIAFFTELGLNLEGKAAVEGPCYMRGPGGIIVALAEELFC